ncbi:hypothetical protein [Rhodococcus sp. EPR-134]|uniref:hypothetical protein n=1 Tax=Rhodococcus sp. EPR-134 TaxID=1813675 RepID=UPI001E522A6C|nr:hypothetical protein [Rhodococcus sp. EPR-134]
MGGCPGEAPRTRRIVRRAVSGDFDPGAARAQTVIEQIAELPDPADSGDPDDDVPYTVTYEGVRLHINPGQARQRGGEGTAKRAE